MRYRRSKLLPKEKGEVYDRYEMILYFVRLDEATMETVRPIIPEYVKEKSPVKFDQMMIHAMWAAVHPIKRGFQIMINP